MKKLLIATDCFLPRWDGIVRFLLEIIPKLKEEYEITILAPNFGEYKTIPDVNVIQFSVFKFNFGDIEFSGFNYSKIKKYVKESDLVFVQTIGPIGTDAIKAAKKLKIPVIAYVHSIEWELTTRSLNKFKWLVNKLTKWYARRHYNRCNLLIVPSIEVEEKHKKNGIYTDKEIVHLGTDVEKFKPIIDKKEAKLKLGFDPYKKIVGFSGRIGREKDLITLYRAFRRIEKKFIDVQLLIVGKGVKELEEIFSSNRNIILPGCVNNVEDYYRAMDIFVLPSLTETSSLATMEAMASSLPVVTTPVGFVKEYIQEKKNGMFFPFKNSLVLSMKLEMLLENDILRETLGKNARATIMSRFRWKHTIEKISEILRRY
jgi:glycosyltransferase involved in cell wall biosynthesis